MKGENYFLKTDEKKQGMKDGWKKRSRTRRQGRAILWDITFALAFCDLQALSTVKTPVTKNHDKEL